MKDISNYFNEDEHGFEGNIEGYLVDTKEDDLKTWLQKEIEEEYKMDLIYKNIKNSFGNVFILKALNINNHNQGQGFGKSLLIDSINNLNPDIVILLCDIGESQKSDFDLKIFYEKNGFKEIFNDNGYPLMVYPKKNADIIIDNISIYSKIKKIFKIK